MWTLADVTVDGDLFGLALLILVILAIIWFVRRV